jgi:ATP-binding cassette subfamily C protein CydD
LRGEAGVARGYLIAAVLLGLAVTGLILAQAGLIAHALGTATAGTGTKALLGCLTALLAVVLARGAAVLAGEVTALRAAAAIKERLRSKLVRHALELGPGWLGGQRSGEVAALTTGGLDALDPYFARYLPQALLAVAVPVAVVTTVTAADWLSGLVIAVTLPVIPVFAVLVGLHTKAQTRRNWQLLGKLSGHFLDVVQGLPTLKVFGRAQAQEQVIARVTSEYRASVMRTLRVAFLSALVLELSAALATALVAVEVGLRLLYGHIGYPTALLVLVLTPEAYLPLRNAAAQFHASADGTAAAARAFEILDVPAPGAPDPARPGPGTHRASVRIPELTADGGRRQGPDRVPDLRSATIRLNAVIVAYPGRPEPVIDGADLTISPGERIIITGQNGAGKSSLLHLLLRFVEPSDGFVAADGVDLALVPAAAWRRQIGWLPQQPALFPWSVAENIALGDPAAPRAAVLRAATLAGADDFIGGLPGGYDTVLDERALRLSTGQRQKIALARLFLRDAPLLLLDEPTAHLDPISAAEVDAAIGTLAVGRTVVVVTHRAGETAAGVRGLVLAGGHITEPARLDLVSGPLG